MSGRLWIADPRAPVTTRYTDLDHARISVSDLPDGTSVVSVGIHAHDPAEAASIAESLVEVMEAIDTERRMRRAAG